MSRSVVRALIMGACTVWLGVAACAAPGTAPAPTTAPAAPAAAPTTRAVPAPTTQAAAAKPQPAATAAPAAAAPAAPAPQAVPAASPAAAPSSQQTGQPTDLPVVQSTGRMVIYTTDITLLVQDLGGLPGRLGTLVTAQGGYVAGVETQDGGGLPAIVVRLKVPPERYEATMASVRGLAVEVRAEKATTQDVTEEYSDAQTQITSLEAQHAQLLELMKRTGSVDELLKVQQQADQVRLQIDRLKGHATALERLSALASITVTAQPVNVVLVRDFVAAQGAVHQAEAQQAGLLAQLKRAQSPNDEAKLRDTLGQIELGLQQARTHLDGINAEATRLQVTLPQPDQSAPATLSDDALAQQYVQTRVDLRKAQAGQQRLTADLEAGVPGASPDRLAAAILHTNTLSLQLKTLQERAGQAGITLPQVSPEEESAMAQVSGPSPLNEALSSLRQAWSRSLSVLVGLGSALVLVWWLLPLGAAAALVVRRRRR